MKTKRDYSVVDNCLMSLDQGIRTLFGVPNGNHRPNPAAELPESPMTEEKRREVIGLMRVNHAGEVSAQALYLGQALTARSPLIKHKLQGSALEENDHLAWCGERIKELGGRVSLLNPVWYVGSFTLGAMAGAFGDAWSLGFLAETEYQVSRHLSKHLRRIPAEDLKTKKILQQMQIDEEKHATLAMTHGAKELPEPIKMGMQCLSQIMTRVAYWV